MRTLCSEAEVIVVAGRSLDRNLTEFTGPNSSCVDVICMRADSSLTVHFDPRWTVVDDTHVLRIDGINTASTTGNNVGTTSSFPSEMKNLTLVAGTTPTCTLFVRILYHYMYC